MDDKELLELAAKAAHGEFGAQMIEGGWNPLTDDGDAFRLAAALDMALHFPPWDVWAESNAAMIHERLGSDRCATMRRAIVRAAAEIGRSQGG